MVKFGGCDLDHNPASPAVAYAGGRMMGWPLLICAVGAVVCIIAIIKLEGKE